MKKFYPIPLILVVIWALLGGAYAEATSPHQVNELEAQLSGANAVPTPVVTMTSGKVKFDVYNAYIEFDLEIDNATAILGAGGAHLHCAPAGQTGPVVAHLAGEVPGGLAGEVDIKGALTQANIVNKACGGTIAQLGQAMAAGNTYVNVHSLAHADGEIRGQVHIDFDDD